MVRRIEVALKPQFHDPQAMRLLAQIKSDFALNNLDDLRRVHAYTFENDISDYDAQFIAKEVFSDAISEHFCLDDAVDKNFEGAIEVGFRPGVKDNVGDTSKAAVEEALSRKIEGRIYTSTLYLFYGEFPLEMAQRIASSVLCNPLIEQWRTLEPSQIKNYYSSLYVPKTGENTKGEITVIQLPDDEKELEKISKRRLLSLNTEEMLAIKKYFENPSTIKIREELGLSRYPGDIELEAIAQTWSEHCKHKIFNAQIEYCEFAAQTNAISHSKIRQKKSSNAKAIEAKNSVLGKTAQTKENSANSAPIKKEEIDSLFKTYIRGTTNKIASAQNYLLSIFEDNAGIITIDSNWALALKAETHNTPSALDPFGGALTGILGVNRDVLGAGLGAKPIFNTDIFCFASPFYKGKIPPRLLHPKRVFEGVRAGVEKGGNASGIPTINGSIVFDERYLGKPLVYCGTGGIMPRKLKDGRECHKKEAKSGDRIFMVGGRIGKDGIHGATFSSVELNETSPTSAVQLGDPFTQKIMLDFLIASRDLGLHNALTDNGAGGLSSSVGEMAQMTNGALLHLERCPLKYPGLDPWEIFVSESQERMSVAVPAKKSGEFAALAAHYGVEATDIGEFTSDGCLKIFYHNKMIFCLDLKFLHEGYPRMHLMAEYMPKVFEDEEFEMPKDLCKELHKMLALPNICSKEYVVRQYDHEVQGTSVIKPMCGKNATGPSDGAVLQPLFESNVAIVASHGICPRYSDYDAYDMAQMAVDEAARNYVATGGDLSHWAALDNFCWPDPIESKTNPDGKQKLAQLVRANKALAEICIAYSLPLVSGKDSMKNDYSNGGIKISVPPTLLVSICGVLKDARKAVSTDFKNSGDIIYILGKTYNELGASEYYLMHQAAAKNAPKVRIEQNILLYKKLHAAMQKGLVNSAHDCSDGGLAVALAECSIGGAIGAHINLNAVPREAGMRDDKILFSESAGRIIATVSGKNSAEFEKLMQGSEFAKIGEVISGEEFSIGCTNCAPIKTSVQELEKSFKKTFDW